MAKKRIKSIYDLTQQADRIRKQYRLRWNDPRVYKAESNEIQRRLKAFGEKGQMMIDVSRVTDDVSDERNFSPSNTSQRLWRMAKMGNKDAERMLYSRDAQSSALANNTTAKIKAQAASIG